MAKFGNTTTKTAAPVTTVTNSGISTTTFEGGGAYTRDAKSDLFLLAVTNMVGEDTFYEGAKTRDDRFRTLIHQVVSEDPGWVARFVPFLRSEMNMRSAAVVMACEYVKAGGPFGRAVINAACARPDEPAEVLGYWTSHYGRKLPMPVKRGVADAVRRLYNEKAALKYDGQSRAWRMADVIELTHPRPWLPGRSIRQLALERGVSPDLVVAEIEKLSVTVREGWPSGVPFPTDHEVFLDAIDIQSGWRTFAAAKALGLTESELVGLTKKRVNEWQNALFKYLLDTRHRGTGNPLVADENFTILLPTLVAHHALAAVPEGQRRGVLRAGGGLVKLADAGMTWEALSGWLPGGMDAEAWEFIIPTMGVMALLRNLRNFDQAGISNAAIDKVIAKITDPAEVAKSRIFPFRVWAAYREAPSDNWKRALGTTLDLTTANVPKLDGSLVLIDCSASMNGGVSGRSKLDRWEIAAVTAAALWKSATNTDVVIFGETNKKLDVPRGSAALRLVERVKLAQERGEVGHATYGHTAVRDHWDPKRHKRVIIITDDQMHDSVDHAGYGYYAARSVDISHVPLVFTANLAGYAPSSLEAGADGRFTLGGFSDAAFKVVDMLGRRDAGWPFDT